MVKVVAEEVMLEILNRLQQSQFFSIHTDESTDICVQQQCGIMLRFFDNTDGQVRCFFFKLELVQNADAEGLFQVLDSNFSTSGPICWIGFRRCECDAWKKEFRLDTSER